MTLDSIEAQYTSVTAEFQGRRPALSQAGEREASGRIREARKSLDEAKRKARYSLNYKRDLNAATKALERCKAVMGEVTA